MGKYRGLKDESNSSINWAAPDDASAMTFSGKVHDNAQSDLHIGAWVRAGFMSAPGAPEYTKFIGTLDEVRLSKPDAAGVLTSAHTTTYTYRGAQWHRTAIPTADLVQDLKRAVDEIRNCGQYVFWRNDDRAMGYASEYNRIHRSAEEPEDEAPVSEPAAAVSTTE